jgi:hypothetical protein
MREDPAGKIAIASVISFAPVASALKKAAAEANLAKQTGIVLAVIFA